MISMIQISFGLLVVIFSVRAAVPVSICCNETQDEKIFNSITDLEVTKLRYEWTIKNLNFSEYIRGESVNSSTFSMETKDKCQWYLFLYPKGINENGTDYMSLFIQSNSCNVDANINFGIKNANNERINQLKFFNNFSKYNSKGYVRFVKQDFVTNNNNGVSVNGSLTIFCELNVISTTDNVPKKVKQLPQDDLGNDFAYLLDNELFSDVIISAGGKDFPALRAILAARSPIFKSKFEHDNQYKMTTRVDIEDLSDDVVKEMLCYIYTGKVSSLDKLAPSLLAVAEKYELVGLKTICENFISDKLTVENVVEFYILADTYSATYLKGQAKDFIIAHASDVTLTPRFKSLIQTHPLLVEDIIHTLIKV